jgi:diguanylate cyclase (GGDEF)-like protein
MKEARRNDREQAMVIPSRQKRRLFWLLAALLLLFHGVVSICLPESMDPLSTLCIVLAELAAIMAAIFASRIAESPTRILWWLLAISIGFHATAMTLDAITEATGTPVFNHDPALSIFFSMLYAVPLLAAVSMQFDSRVLRTARVTNAVFSLAIGVLLYLQISSSLATHGSRNPADAVLILHLFDGIDLFLALAATIRWVGSDSAAEREFFRITSIFLWLNALFPAIHNRILMHHDYVWLDLFISFPYVVLCALVAARQDKLHRPPSSEIIYLIQSGSAIFPSIGLVVMGVVTARMHFYLGLGAALLSIIGYGVLSTLAQSRGRVAEESLLTSKEALEDFVGLDALTGIPNRWAFDQTLNRECAASRRSRAPVSLLMIDVDYFKLLNDAEGHQVGDECLIRIASALRTSLPRQTDFIARYGGEEFSAILPATDASGAEEAAGKICAAVANLDLRHPVSSLGRVTVSVGFSTYHGSSHQSAAGLVRAADHGLYNAKRHGRHRWEFFPLEAVARIERLNSSDETLRGQQEEPFTV